MSHQLVFVHYHYSYLTQFFDELKRKKKLPVKLYDFSSDAMAINRLYEDSDDLLLPITDGKLCEMVKGKKVDK